MGGRAHPAQPHPFLLVREIHATAAFCGDSPDRLSLHVKHESSHYSVQ